MEKIKNFLGIEKPPVPKVDPKLLVHDENSKLDPTQYQDPYQTELFAHDFKLHAVLINNECPELNGYNLHIYRQDGGLYDIFVYVGHEPRIAVFHKRRSMKDDSYTKVGPQLTGTDNLQLDLEQLDRHMEYLDIQRTYARPIVKNLDSK
jgi:hypothetical protein